MDFETIGYATIEPGIGVLSLQRVEAYNAVNHRMMQELHAFWAARSNDADTQVIIMQGEGRGFCAGFDIKESIAEMERMTMREGWDIQAGLSAIVALMRKAPQPIIAAVHGAAMGLGFSFTLASDVRVISDDARFSAAYINVGLGGADMACSYLLPRLIGAGRASEMMLTGATLSAAEVMDLGLASRMVPRGELFETALGLARTMNAKNPLGLRMTKQALNTSMGAVSLEQATYTENLIQVFLAAKAKLEHDQPIRSPLSDRQA